MSDTSSQQPCLRCSTPGSKQHFMRRLYINFSECVDMCPNTKCQWMQLVSADLGANCQTPLLGGISSTTPGPGVDPFDQLLDSLPSVDSGLEVDGSDRSVASCWESAPSDAGSLCSELAGVGLSSVTSERSSEAGVGPSSAASEPCAGVWRSQSAPAGHHSTAGDSLVTDTRSEPAPARRVDRRGRVADPRPLPGLVLRAFNNSETRLSPADQAASQTPSSGSRRSQKAHSKKAAKKLQRAERLEKAAAANAAAQVDGKPACASTSTPAAASSASSGSAGAASAARSTSSRGVTAPAGPGLRPVHRPTAWHALPHAVSMVEVAAKMDSVLAPSDLLQRLRSTHNTDLVYVRARQVERVKTWAKKKADAAAAATGAPDPSGSM